MSTRTLSRSQAAQCESAATKRCRCRCGGALHGANRIAEDELDQLPATDPHRVNDTSTANGSRRSRSSRRRSS